MNETLHVLKERRSCRNFTNQPLEEETLQTICQSGLEGEYEGIGHCALGYAAQEPKPAAERKEDYIIEM